MRRRIVAALGRVRWGTVSFVLLGLVALAWLYGDSLYAHVTISGDPLMANDDAMQQIPPFFRYEDGTLRDYIYNYYLAALPVGYRAMYRIAGMLGGAIALSKLLPYVLLLIHLAGLAVATNKIGGRFAAWFALAIALGSSVYLWRMSGGLPRSFAFPIASCALAALAHGRMSALAVITCVGAAFYPVASVVTGLALACVLLLLPAKDRGEAASWTFGTRCGVLFATAATCVALLVPSTLAVSKFGRTLTPDDVAEYPELGPGGRYGSGDRAPFAGFMTRLGPIAEISLAGNGDAWSDEAREWLDEKPKGEKEAPRRDILYEVLAVVAILGWLALLRRRAEARRVLVYGLAAFVGYTVARTVPPFLYLPERYALYTLPPVVALTVPVTLGGLAAFARRRRRWLETSLTVVASLAVLGLVGGRGDTDRGLARRGSSAPGLVEAVRALPPSAVIAGWPTLNSIMNDLPYLTRRHVFVSYETHQTFHKDYADEMRRRMSALTAAYFARSIDPLIALRDRDGVTHVLLIPQHLSGKKPPGYFKPFDEKVQQATRGDKPYELLRQMDHAAIFTSGQGVLIDLALLRP